MTLWFGGDYNPEQWPREVWDEDVRLMGRAGVTVATVGVFSWAQLEPEDGRFEFEWLDDVLGRLHAGGIGVDLATATASPPPWALRGYPDIAPVTADGVRLGGGSRQHYSPHSPSYRRLAGRLVRALAERYGSHPALVAWHVNNEFGCHVSRCYGEHAADAFRAWLRARYETVDALNAAWGTAFWSQRYANFDEIEPPRAAPTLLNPAQVLDFDRFSSDALLDLHRAEAAILREFSPGVPITTNFMGPFRALDYWRWAEEVDFVSDDSYPDPADPDSPATAALGRDLMRSLAGDRPWVLMEQAPSAVNWRPRNAPSRRAATGCCPCRRWPAARTGSCTSSGGRRPAAPRPSTPRWCRTAGRTPGSTARSRRSAPNWAPSGGWSGSRCRPASRSCSTGPPGGRWSSRPGRRR
nr:beta-galactosidase [Jiangella muralis]